MRIRVNQLTLRLSKGIRPSVSVKQENSRTVIEIKSPEN
jgi:hypothetical protein